jgi:hypothetical protein
MVCQNKTKMSKSLQHGRLHRIIATLDPDPKGGAGDINGEEQADPTAREGFVVNFCTLLEIDA